MPPRWPVTLTVLMGTVAVVLNATVVNVAIPPTMAEFGMSQVVAQWLATGTVIFPVAGRLADRVPAHRLILAGCAGFAIAAFGIARSEPTTAFLTLACWIAFGRIALGLMMPALNIGGLRSLPESLTLQGSGMINFARQLGGAFGVNLLALLLELRVSAHLGAQMDLHQFYEGAARNNKSTAALTKGFSETFIVCGMLFAVAMMLAAWMGYLHAKLRKDSSRL